MSNHSHVFHRHTLMDPPIADHGDGIYLIDTTGKRYLDASGGAAVSCLGHSDAEVIAAAKQQLDQMAFAHTSFFTNAPMEELADLLVGASPPALDRVYFTSGGSEAVEAALKMARQYFVERGEPKRRNYIARSQSYHGNTLGALSVGGNKMRREPFRDVLLDTHHIMPAFAYRYAQDGETEDAFAERAANALAEQIEALGPETVIAFVAETVVGATAGAATAPRGYFKRIREICDRYGVLLILDEVMCGMGRTGSLFAFEQEDIVPDMVTFAKGLAAGYQPVGAVLVNAHIFEAFQSGSGAFMHGHTFMGHPVSCAAAVAVQKKLQAPHMMSDVRRLGQVFEARLHEVFTDHPHIGDIRGRGLFRGLELVADRVSKEPFDPQAGLAGAIKRAAFERGLICYPGGGTIDGRRGDHILLAPPYIVNERNLADIATTLRDAVDTAISVIT